MTRRLLLSGATLALTTCLALMSCSEDETEPVTTGDPPDDPVCGNAEVESGEECDPYAPANTWSCPNRACAEDCTCIDEMGSGGGGMGGSGGTGGEGTGIGAGMPIGGTGEVACEPATGTPGALVLEEIVTGFTDPVAAVAPNGEADRLYVVEQPGRIILYEGGSGSVFLDITEKVSSGGERGLLGLAFHPDYTQNGRFWIHYSSADGGDTVVEEYARDANDPDAALPDPVGDPLLEVEQPAGNHNGGFIGISPDDDHLYVALGDGGGSGDTYGNGQNIMSRLGGILRLDVSVLPAQPAGNYPGGDAYLWSVGLRNPWRSSFDACTGDLYIGDVGQNAIEEIDVEPAGTAHRNYGWNTMEGSSCYEPATGCDQTGLTLPVTEYPQAEECSVTGGYVYRGSAIPWLRGTYFYGDFCTGRIWTFEWDGAAADNLTDRGTELDSLGNIRISSFGQDASGEVYVFDYVEGTLYRVASE
jgi:glucose/arabinose dehydrogenase